MKVLGLDLSLRATGACILEDVGEERPRCWTTLFTQPEAKTIEERTERLCAIAGFVLSLYGKESPDLVVIEAAAKNQVYQGAAIGELHGAVRTQLFLAFGVHPAVCQATQMRKAVVGKIERKSETVTITRGKRKGKKKQVVSYGMVPGKSGRMRRATVKDVVEQRLREWGWEFPTQDEMDAFVAAKFGLLNSSPGQATDGGRREEEPRA